MNTHIREECKQICRQQPPTAPIQRCHCAAEGCSQNQLRQKQCQLIVSAAETFKTISTLTKLPGAAFQRQGIAGREPCDVLVVCGPDLYAVSCHLASDIQPAWSCSRALLGSCAHCRACRTSSNLSASSLLICALLSDAAALSRSFAFTCSAGHSMNCPVC